MLVIQSLLLSIGIDSLDFLKWFVGQYLYNVGTFDIENEKIIEISSQKMCACTLDEFGLRFWPPLYMQRYMVIQEILEHPIWNGSIKKVVDYGCSELGLFKCIKPIPGLNNIMLVDVDYNTLDLNQTKVLPTNFDYVSISERREPLTVDIYNGSIADLDDRMLGMDAVICIELIEHLYSDVLDALPYNVFKFIKPKIAVFTTPNVEFNILFPNFNKQFRHDDHKFEWTRKQFKAWAKKITTQYPEYAVQFDGIGSGPAGTDDLGCCSQMAIFYQKKIETSPVKPIGSTPYKLLRRVSYPFEIFDEKVANERAVYEKLSKFISEALCLKKYIVHNHMEIPLKSIMPHISDNCSSIFELKDLVDKLYETRMNDDEEWYLIKVLTEFSSSECMSDSDSLSNCSGQVYSLLEETVKNYNCNDEENDWDSLAGMSFGESKLCYSTPMTKNQQSDDHLNSIDSFNTIFSNSDLYKTAIDYNKIENEDMEISSSCNGSIIVDNCNIYQDFVTGRRDSTNNEEDINEIEDTLTGVVNDCLFSNDSDFENINNIINDKTVIQNSSNISLKSNQSFDTIHELKLEDNGNFINSLINEGEKEIDNKQSMCLNRTLLDKNGFTENLLSTSDKKKEELNTTT